MKKITSTLVICLVILAACGQSPKKQTTAKYPVSKTDEEWKKILSPTAFQVMVKKGTEPPYMNPYFDNHEKGIYVSAATGEPLFSSDDKYDSGTGWPSFTKPINPKLIKIITDMSDDMVRDEVVEAKTGLHLGHVFDDGPEDKGGKRYCMNSAALKFIKK
jgi:peptide-methionine (R)-S-oxide reductase